jgi:hypothetical protein
LKGGAEIFFRRAYRISALAVPLRAQLQKDLAPYLYVF